ncbi:TolC family protein [Paludibaculum fermentans]|uniref:TolC family protein n=1 Tax=Paludibaculum fermentans TaxID=1473598 RepID=UPI003EBCB019
MANRLSFAVPFTLAVLCSGASASAAETLTLDQAIALALNNNGTLQSSALDVLKAQDKLAYSRTRLFPNFSLYMLAAQQLRSFDFTLEKGVLGDYAGTGPLPSQDVHLKTPLEPTGIIMGRVSQPLTTLIRIQRNLDTLRTGVKLAEEQTRVDRQKTVRDVKKLYYTLQQFDASLRSIRETSGLYEEVEKLTSKYVFQQVALKGDLLDARMRLAKTQQSEMYLLNQQATAREQLNQLLGRDVTAEFEVQSVLEASSEEITLQEAHTRALENRPEIRQAELRGLQAEQDLRAKKAEYIPDVAAEFNNLSFLNWGRFMPTQTLSVGVSLTWEPFDWNRKKHEMAEKRHIRDQAQVSKRDARNSVLADVNDKYRQLRYYRGELLVARMAQQTAIENLRVANNKYRLQSVLLKDVLQAQVSLEQTNSDSQQALTSFWNARADFERAIGEDR